MFPEQIIYVGVLLNLIGEIFYLRGMFLGDTKPNLVSWFIWMLAPFVGVFFQLKAGAGLSVLPIFMAGFGPFLVITYSLIRRNAYWKINSFDLVCGLFSFIALVVYIFTYNIELSVIFVILSDGLAAIPTIKKSWNFPATESAYIYLFAILNNILGLFIIKEWSFSIYSLGIYFIAINIIITFCILRKDLFKSISKFVCYH